MKATIGKVIFGVIVLAVVGWWAHDRYRDSKVASAHQKQRAEREKQSQGAVVAAAKHYGAIIGWEESLKPLNSQPFSVQLEDVIIPKDGKPIVVAGFVEDIARHDDRFYLYLNDWNTSDFSIQFVLECDAAMARRLIERKEFSDTVTVIAQISSVEKAQFALESGVKRTEDPAPIEIDSSSQFLTHGKCLQVIFSDN